MNGRVRMDSNGMRWAQFHSQVACSCIRQTRMLQSNKLLTCETWTQLCSKAEGRTYIVDAAPVHYYLARRRFYDSTTELPDEDIDSNAENALEETYETTEFCRSYLPDAFREGVFSVRTRPCKTIVHL